MENCQTEGRHPRDSTIFLFRPTWVVAFLSFSRSMSLLACSSSISSSSSCIFCSRRLFSSSMDWDLLDPLLSSSWSSSRSASAWRRSLSEAEWSCVVEEKTLFSAGGPKIAAHKSACFADLTQLSRSGLQLSWRSVWLIHFSYKYHYPTCQFLSGMIHP